jgi:hypothetical protein
MNELFTQFLRTAIICVLFLDISLSSYSQNITTLENGDQIAWDGEYYDFRAADGVKMIKMWIPPNTEPIRGMFISGHGGGSGDSRSFARDENVRAFAMRMGFAVVGLHNFPGRRVYDGGAKVFFQALNEFATLGYHPEIKNLPFVMYGSSNGGAATYGFVNYAPERALCFLCNVSAGYNPEIPTDAALRVPGIFIMGKYDALIRQRGIDATKDIMKVARSQGALWSWALELKGHEDGASFDVYMKLVEQVVAARYPSKNNITKKPLKLVELKEEDGWLADLNDWDSGLTTIAPFAEFVGEKQKAGWLLNEDMANVYRSMATHHNPISLSIKEFDRTYNPHVDPGTMFSLGGPVANPREEITITCNTEEFPDWQKIEIFDGAQKLGEMNSGSEPVITTELDGSKKVYCLTALATDNKGVQRTCNPFHFFVRDTTLSWKRVKNKEIHTHKSIASGSKSKTTVFPGVKTDQNDSILISYGLNADQERNFSIDDGITSPFWNLIDEKRDMINMNPRQNAPRGEAFSFVLTHDCKMTVKSAHGTHGLYLLFEIMDDNDVAWPNRLTGTETEVFYYNFDAVDVLLDSRSIQSIADSSNDHMFLSPGFALTTTSKQYQVACGTPKERPEGFKRTTPEPWDFHSTYYTFKEAADSRFVQIELLTGDHFFKAQEWFIPWSEIGAGFKEEPDLGTRMGFSPGYNDRDAGEHFPPGVNASGGSVKSANSLKWIGKSNPWAHSYLRDESPYGWGELVIGPLLK